MSKLGNRPSSTATKEQSSLPYHFIDIVLSLPRFARIVIAAIFGLAVSAASFPIIDRTYLTSFFSEQTTVIPSLVSAGLGLVMYVVGWVLLVGTRGSQLPKRIGILFYLIAGITIVVFVLILVVNGYFSSTVLDV